MIATTTSSIHEATEQELWGLAKHGHEFYSEAGLPGRFVPMVFVNTWSNAISSGRGALFVWEHEGQCAGFLGGMAYPDPNDGELVAMELFWFVRREHRGHLGSVRLLKTFEEWAKSRGCSRVAMVHLLNEASEGLPRFYDKMGYRPIETHYIKEL